MKTLCFSYMLGVFPMEKTYHITTYGCQMNLSDSQRIAFLLETLGYKNALNQNRADLIVVNMCSIRQAAVDRVFGLMQKIKGSQIKILTGCIAKRDMKKFARLFDFILPIKSLPQWKKILKQKPANYFANKKRLAENKDLNINYLKIPPSNINKYSASIPISYGCDNFCSFCVVPYTRGPLVCRNPKDILSEARRAIKTGAKEIWLLGQNVNHYKFKMQKSKCKIIIQNAKLKNFDYDFLDLIKEVNAISGDFWIRFTSPHPAQITDKFIETLAKCEKITPYINLPMQSGDDTILRKMNRPYTIRQYREIIQKLRKAFKKYRKGMEAELAISTDVIVGFPNETKEQFCRTAANFENIGFDMAFIAEYSPRPDTLAAKQDNISNSEKKRRYRVLNQILGQSALARNRKYKNRKISVLISNIAEKNGKFLYTGKTRHNKSVAFTLPEKKAELLGNFSDVKIKSISPWNLKGEWQRGND